MAKAHPNWWTVIPDAFHGGLNFDCPWHGPRPCWVDPAQRLATPAPNTLLRSGTSAGRYHLSRQSSTLRPPCHPWKISRLVRLQLVQEPQALPIDTSSLVTQNWCTKADDLDMTRLTDLFIITYHSSHCWGMIRGVSWYFQFSHTFPGRNSVKIAKPRDSPPHYPHSARSVPVGRPLKRQFNGLA